MEFESRILACRPVSLEALPSLPQRESRSSDAGWRRAGSTTVGEESCSYPADCGAPPATEQGLCQDGIDNDRDGLVDCADFVLTEQGSQCPIDPI